MFIALFPDADSRGRLARIAGDLSAEYGGRPVPAENVHITLRFLGMVGPASLSCLEQLLNGIRLDTFELVINDLEYRGRQRMVWALPRNVPGQVRALADQVEREVQACGFAAADHTFLPHLTLVRKVVRKPVLRSRELAVKARFDEICLVESRTLPEGSTYMAVKSLPLQGSGT